VTEFEVEHRDGLRWLKRYQGTEMTTRVSNLLPGQEYQVRVRALGRDKAFPFSDILMVTTKVGGKYDKYDHTSKLVMIEQNNFCQDDCNNWELFLVFCKLSAEPLK
jgi:hypothetical protein